MISLPQPMVTESESMSRSTTTIAKQVRGKHGDKAVGLRLQRRHPYAPSSGAGDLGQRVDDGATLAECGDRGIV